MPYLIQVLLPVTETVEQQTLEDIRSEMTDRFGGVTLHSNAPAEGLWSNGADLERDRIIVIEVMTGQIDRSWWGKYREGLEHRLSQQEIVVRATQIERL